MELENLTKENIKNISKEDLNKLIELKIQSEILEENPDFYNYILIDYKNNLPSIDVDYKRVLNKIESIDQMAKHFYREQILNNFIEEVNKIISVVKANEL